MHLLNTFWFFLVLSNPTLLWVAISYGWCTSHWSLQAVVFNRCSVNLHIKFAYFLLNYCSDSGILLTKYYYMKSSLFSNWSSWQLKWKAIETSIIWKAGSMTYNYYAHDKDFTFFSKVYYNIFNVLDKFLYQRNSISFNYE